MRRDRYDRHVDTTKSEGGRGAAGRKRRHRGGQAWVAGCRRSAAKTSRQGTKGKEQSYRVIKGNSPRPANRSAAGNGDPGGAEEIEIERDEEDQGG